jgi:acetoin utilization deacetylase AcuC-like enzyme
MKRTGFLYDERFLLHDTGPDHPECSDRIRAAFRGIEEAGLLSMLVLIKAKRAARRWIETVHTVDQLQRLEKSCLMGVTEFDCPDNQMCRDTFETSMLAIGGILETARMIMEGSLKNAFCAVRPPGHHAEIDQAMGFCYFNNIAIAAKYLQMEWGVERVGIIDFDVHHGNGTQHIFDHDPTVFFYSIHEHPSFSYPGTGREFEKGLGAGHGYTLNSPMLPGSGDEEYMEAFERDLLPAFDLFKPDFILVSAGFDAHVDDDMSNIKLSTDCFSWMMERIVEMADKYAGGKLISVLEGGYSIKRLPELIRNHVKVLLGGIQR